MKWRPAPVNADLLAGIRTSPDEDVPRLAYADWLEEEGRPDCARVLRLCVEGRLQVKFFGLRLAAYRTAIWKGGDSWEYGKWSSQSPFRGASFGLRSLAGDMPVIACRLPSLPYRMAETYFHRGMPYKVSCQGGQWLKVAGRLAQFPISVVTLSDPATLVFDEVYPVGSLVPHKVRLAGEWVDAPPVWEDPPLYHAAFRFILRCRWPSVGEWKIVE